MDDAHEETAAHIHTLIPDDETLIRCYAIVGVAVDQLPYSPDLDRIVTMYRQQTGKHISPSIAFGWLMNLRKGAHLPKLKKVTPYQELWIAAGQIPARFYELWIASEIVIYKGAVSFNKPVKGDFVGSCLLSMSAHHIAKLHNDALLTAWGDADARDEGRHPANTAGEVSYGTRRKPGGY